MEQENQPTPKYTHDIYKHQPEEKNAEAIAWCYTSKKHFERFPYQHPALAADEVRASILYSGLCMSDSHTGREKWGPAKFPLAPGHEIIGQVEEVGANVTEFKKGDKVAFGTMRACCGKCQCCLNGKEPLCREPGMEKFTYGTYWGGYSTHLQQPASHFFKIPDGLNLEKSAPLLCAGITVYNPIKQYCKPGMKTAVIGIGGLGHLAVMFLAKMGYEVTGVTNSIEKEKFIRSLGANDVLVMSDAEMYKKHLNKYDFIINTIPVAGDFNGYLSLLGRMGTLCQVGAPDIHEKVSFTANLLMYNEWRIVGSIVGSRGDIKEMLEFCQKNEVYPIVEEYKFEDFDKALDKLENGKPIFRCVVNCHEFSKARGLQKF